MYKPAPTPSPWTEAIVEDLKRLIGEGLSASQIAAALGGGITRNAVVGKCHRSGLRLPNAHGYYSQPRRSPAEVAARKREQARRYREKAAGVPASAPRVAPRYSEPAGPRIMAKACALPAVAANPPAASMVEREDWQCPWPTGEGFACCGLPREDYAKGVRLPYCKEHNDAAMPSRNLAKRRERVPGYAYL